MKQIKCGNHRHWMVRRNSFNTCASHALVNEVHVAEIKADRLAEIAQECGARTATADYRELLENDNIDTFIVSATPEHTHYTMTRDCLLAGKHVLLEKPLALELEEADELIALPKSEPQVCDRLLAAI